MNDTLCQLNPLMITTAGMETPSLTPIQRTLLIPLVGRAEAADRFPELGFADPAATRVAASLGGTSDFAEDRAIVWGSIQRSLAIDGVAAAFLTEHPGAPVLQLGAGLCTRRERLPHALAQGRAWIDLDHPEVLALRKEHLASDATTLPVDFNDPASTDAALTQALGVPTGPVLVLAEGLSMFLNPGRFEQVLAALGARLPLGSEVVFDYIHPLTRKISGLQPSLKRTGAVYHSGIADVARAAGPAFEVLDTRLFTRRYRGALRGAERVVRAMMGGASLFDVAHLRLTDPASAPSHRTTGSRLGNAAVVLNTFLGFGLTTWIAGTTQSTPLYWVAELVAGLFIVRGFCLIHELSHASLVKSRGLGDAVGLAASLIPALPYMPWKRIHIEHHTWAGHREKDPTESDTDFADLAPLEQLLANFAWRYSIPILGVSFSFRTFWNYPKLMRLFPKSRVSLLVSILIIPAAHLAAYSLWGSAYLRAYWPAFLVFCVIMDPVMLSQHIGIPMPQPTTDRPLRTSEQESLARTLVFPRLFARHVLLGFNYHSVHHAKPSLPGHQLDRVSFAPTYEEGWWTWLKQAKRQSLGELLTPQTESRS